eukprot:683578-Prorocentrum_minimum.AAC.1
MHGLCRTRQAAAPGKGARGGRGEARRGFRGLLTKASARAVAPARTWSLRCSSSSAASGVVATRGWAAGRVTRRATSGASSTKLWQGESVKRCGRLATKAVYLSTMAAGFGHCRSMVVSIWQRPAPCAGRFGLGVRVRDRFRVRTMGVRVRTRRGKGWGERASGLQPCTQCVGRVLEGDPAGRAPIPTGIASRTSSRHRGVCEVGGRLQRARVS